MIQLLRSSQRQSGFLLLWVGQSVSLLGSQITRLALPLAAAVALGSGPVQIGILNAAQTLPVLLVALPAGVWVDRSRRKTILICCDLFRAATLLTIPISAVMHTLSLAQILVVAMLTGTATVLSDVAQSAYLSTLVPEDALAAANGRLQASESVTQVAGPALAGTLIAALSAPIAIAFDSLSFFLSAGVLAPLPDTYVPAEERGKLLPDILEGLRTLTAMPLVRATVLSAAIFELFDGVLFAVYILFILRTLGLGSGWIGLVFGIGGCGSILGAALAGRVVRVLGDATTLLVTVVGGSVSELCIGLAVGPHLLAGSIVAAAEAGVEVTLTIFAVTIVVVRQRSTAAYLQGRVSATSRFVVGLGGPVGSITGGLLGAHLGLRQTVLLAGAGTLLSVVPLAALRGRGESLFVRDAGEHAQ